MLYVLAHPEFEPPTAEKLEQFRFEHEPDRARLVPAHVTLVFGLRMARAAEIAALCTTVAGSASELSITFVASEVAHDPFEKAYKLFLMVGPGKDALAELHHRLYAGAHRAELDSSSPYRPHMTIATHAEKAYIDRLNSTEVARFFVKAKIGSLEVVELSEGKLNTVTSVALGGS